MKKIPELNLICNSLRIGGAERQASCIMQRFPVKRLMLIENDIKLEAKAEIVSILSGYALPDPSWLKVLSLPLLLARIWPFRKDLDGKLIISFNTRPNFINVLAGLIYGNNSIISERMNPSLSWKGGLKIIQKWLSAIIYRFADVIVVNSQGVKADLARTLRLNKKKICVIYNAIDLQRIKSLLSEPITKEEEKLFASPVVITVGRQRKAKGQWHLIRAFAETIKTLPDAKLIILGGSGEFEQRQKALVEDMGLNQSVFFLGEKTNPFKYISRAQVFALPSLHEGFPNVILEALACNCPIIAADCKFGPREILSNSTDYSNNIAQPSYEEYGVLMPVFTDNFSCGSEPLTNDESLWGREIARFLSDSQKLKNYRSRCAARVADFSLETIMLEWESLIKEFSPLENQA